jgi:GNAT superfamily N-acetyltransferase
MSDSLKLRVATLADVDCLHTLIAVSVRGLMPQEYTPAQLEAALGNWLGLDTQLIKDETYFVVETSERELVGCGGWSKRKTPYGSDHRANREDELLDPATEAAKIRAFFVHPEWSRRGIGKMLLDASEAAARDAGFHKLEMGATLTGIPLYARFGYVAEERVGLPLEGGGTLEIVKMTKGIE